MKFMKEERSIARNRKVIHKSTRCRSLSSGWIGSCAKGICQPMSCFSEKQWRDPGKHENTRSRAPSAPSTGRNSTPRTNRASTTLYSACSSRPPEPSRAGATRLRIGRPQGRVQRQPTSKPVWRLPSCPLALVTEN